MARGPKKSIEEKITAKQELINALYTRVESEKRELEALFEEKRMKDLEAVNELIEEAGGFVQEPAKIISGGPMMGFGIFDLNVPTTKTSSALLCLTHDDVADSQPSACINCGRCVEVCPGRVVPKLLADYAERHDLERFEACNGLECCECGCCSYVCPAKRPLTQAIKSARKMVLAEKKKKQQEAKK